MGAAAGQKPTVKCPQGHINPAGRQFCQVCGRRITASAESIDHPTDPQPSDEVKRLTMLLAASQQDNQRLQEEMSALRQEVESSKATAAATPPPGLIAELEAKLREAEQRASDPQLLEWKQRWKGAVEKAGALEERLAATVRDFEAHKAQGLSQQPQRKDGDGGQPVQRPKLMLLGALMTILGGAGGFGVDRMIIPSQSEVQATISQLKAQIDGHRANAQKLTAQLNSVTHEAAVIAADLTAETAARKKAESELQNDPAPSRIKALLLRYPGAKIPENTQGVLQWQGEVKTDKGVNVVIDHGVATIASRDGISKSVSGNALPGVPVVLQPASDNVYILEPPRKDNWSRVVFHIVEKNRNATVQLRWTVL